MTIVLIFCQCMGVTSPEEVVKGNSMWVTGLMISFRVGWFMCRYESGRAAVRISAIKFIIKGPLLNCNFSVACACHIK